MAVLKQELAQLQSKHFAAEKQRLVLEEEVALLRQPIQSNCIPLEERARTIELENSLSQVRRDYAILVAHSAEVEAALRQQLAAAKSRWDEEVSSLREAVGRKEASIHSLEIELQSLCERNKEICSSLQRRESLMASELQTLREELLVKDNELDDQKNKFETARLECDYLSLRLSAKSRKSESRGSSNELHDAEDKCRLLEAALVQRDGEVKALREELVARTVKSNNETALCKANTR